MCVCVCVCDTCTHAYMQVKYDYVGKRLWTRIIGSNGTDSDIHTYIYITWTHTYMQVKYDYVGKRLWTRLVGSNGTDSDASVSARGDSLVVIGSTMGSILGLSNSGNGDIFIVQVEPCMYVCMS